MTLQYVLGEERPVPATAAWPASGRSAILKRAIAVTDTALRSTMRQVKAGMTEREVAALLTIEMLQAGGEGLRRDRGRIRRRYHPHLRHR